MYLDLHDIDIVCLTEHWLKPAEIESIKIAGYKKISIFCRSSHKNGGVVIFCKINKQFKIRELTYITDSSIEKSIEITGVEIKFSKYIIKLLAIYRSPQGNINEFITTLDRILHRTVTKCNVIVCGDLNIDYLSPSTNKDELCDLLQTYNLNMVISEPTRISLNKKSCIDYVCTNFTNTSKVNCKVLNDGLSDHTSQIFECEYIMKEPFVKDDRYSRTYNEANYKNYYYQLGNENWQDVFDAVTVEEGFNNFVNIMSYYHDSCFPYKKISTKHAKNAWITPGIKKSSEKLKFLYQIKSATNNPNDINYYNKYKKIYKKVIIDAKKLYNDSFYSKANNKTKAIWSIINDNTCDKKMRNEINEIKIDNKTLTEASTIAQQMNKYFIDQPAKLNDELGVTPDLNLNSIPVYPSIFLEPVTENEIFNIIMELKNSNASGVDNISTNLIKKSVKFLVGPLTYLINLSLSEGIFPSILKIAKVFPLHKKGDNTLPDNYRPVALLSSISKIVERVVFNRIINFAEKNKILSNAQHGFRKKYSTQTAILAFLEKIHENLNQNNKCAGLFMDLSKAFDLINHSILIKKLEKYGLRGKAKDWLTSYLTNRFQLVEVNGTKSEKLKIEFGVPQGSVLGPLLFLFYINDLPNFFDEFLIMFADDNSYLCCGRAMQNTLTSLQDNIEKYAEYFKTNRLFLNISKTVFIVFSPRNSTYDKSHLIKLDGQSIQQTGSTKFLGLHIDNALNWDTHISNVANKISSTCYALYRLSKLATRQTVLTYYYAHFVSRISYGIIFWGSAHNSERIFKLQKKAIRYILGASKYESCKKLFKDLQLLTLPCIYILEVLIYVKNNINLFVPNNYNHNYNTREGNNLMIPLHNLSKYEENPRYMGILLYNKLPHQFKNINNIQTFKKEVKTFLINNCFYSVKEYLEV